MEGYILSIRKILLLIISSLWVPTGMIVCQVVRNDTSSVSTSGAGAGAGASARPKVVNVGALFTMDSVIGKSVRPAIVAAVDDVNSNTNILHGTKLNLIVHDTNCSGFVGTVEGNS